jgi:uncharacterized protein (TIGR02246 family)
VDLTVETAAVRARGEAWFAAEKAKDTEGAVAFFTPDAIVQFAGAPQVQGHDAIRTGYNTFFQNPVKRWVGASTHLDVSRGGDIAFEYGVDSMTLTSPSGDVLVAGKYLAVWKKVNNEWFVSAMSATSDTPAPVPVAAR